MKNSIDIERARELFEYRDGQLIRKLKVSSNARIGDVAGYARQDGYMVVSIDDKKYRNHRIIYAIVHGIDAADKDIDHIDGNPSNNHIENLRLATDSENLRNRKGLDARNTSGFRGVSWHTQKSKWRACIVVNGLYICGGYFVNIIDANAKAIELREAHFGAFKGD